MGGKWRKHKTGQARKDKSNRPSLAPIPRSESRPPARANSGPPLAQQYQILQQSVVHERPKRLTGGEIISIVLGTVGILLAFFIGAPATAGVTDISLARLLLLGGCIAAVLLAFTIEKLYHRSWKRILTTLTITALASIGLAIYANVWIGTKKAEQEVRELLRSNDPVTKESLLRALEAVKALNFKDLTGTEVIQQIRKRGVAFQVDPFDEEQIRDLASYLSAETSMV